MDCKRKDKSLIGNGIFDPRLPARTKGEITEVWSSRKNRLRKVKTHNARILFIENKTFRLRKITKQRLHASEWRVMMTLIISFITGNYDIGKTSNDNIITIIYINVFSATVPFLYLTDVLLYVSNTCNALWATDFNRSGPVSPLSS